MKTQVVTIVAATILAIVAGSQLMSENSTSQNEQLSRQKFENFVVSYGRKYISPAEKEFRFKVFVQNLEEIVKINSANISYKYGLNNFSDMTQEEFKAKYLGYVSNKKESELSAMNQHSLTSGPASVDWRTKGAVTPVKDQGACGSCWAFAATGALEGAYFLKNGSQLSFSEQHLVDCSWLQGNLGCSGGLANRAFRYWEKKGFLKESDYEYTAKNGNCQYEKKKDLVVGKLSKFIQNGNTEDDLLESLVIAPTAVAVNATPLMKYSSGIYSDTTACPANFNDLNHAVLAVGYGADSAGNKFWIVKNSWGTSWGENGYFRLGRGVIAGGVCGVALDTSIAKL